MISVAARETCLHFKYMWMPWSSTARADVLFRLQTSSLRKTRASSSACSALLQSLKSYAENHVLLLIGLPYIFNLSVIISLRYL